MGTPCDWCGAAVSRGGREAPSGRSVRRVVRRYADLRGGEPAFSSATTYAVFDGLFERGLLSHLCGD